MQTALTKLSPVETRKLNLVLRRMNVEETNPVAYSVALGYILPYLDTAMSVSAIGKVLKPIWPLYEKSVESIELSLG